MLSIKSWDGLQLLVLFIFGTIVTAGSISRFNEMKTVPFQGEDTQTAQYEVNKIWLDGKENLESNSSNQHDEKTIAQEKNNRAVSYFFSSSSRVNTPTDNEDLTKALRLATEATQGFAQSGSKVDLAIALHNQSVIERDLGMNMESQIKNAESARLFKELRGMESAF